MMETDLRRQARQQWEAAAPGWVKWEREFASGLVEVTDTLLDMAGVREGLRVLDLACGAGQQSLQAARRVGPTGRVVASDISPTMLENVRASAQRAGLANVEILESSAEDLAAEPGRFDAAISRLGLMLFTNPGQALDGVHAALKPGKRMAALVFTVPASNPFMAEPMQILLRHAGKAPPAPGQPGIFALGRPGQLEGLLAEHGYADLESRVVRAPLHLASAAPALEMMQQAFGAYRAVLAELPEEARAAAWREVRECLGQFETAEGFRAELEFVIGAGAKAG
jgi:SAM-dependent methyltransferase